MIETPSEQEQKKVGNLQIAIQIPPEANPTIRETNESRTLSDSDTKSKYERSASFSMSGDDTEKKFNRHVDIVLQKEKSRKEQENNLNTYYSKPKQNKIL